MDFFRKPYDFLRFGGIFRDIGDYFQGFFVYLSLKSLKLGNVSSHAILKPLFGMF